MAAEREPIRLVGRVREVSDPPPGSWRISVDGRDLQAWRAGSIVVEVDHREIRVDLERTTCSGPATSEGQGAWSEVRDQIPALDQHPAPFKRTSFEAVTPQVGDVVALYGDVVARDDAEVGYREAPPSTVTRVLARLLARGDDATALLVTAIHAAYPAAVRPAKRDPRLDDEGNPRNRPPLSRWIACALAVAAAVVTLVFAQWTIAIGFLACALIARPSRVVRNFRTRDDDIPDLTFDLFTLRAWGSLYPVVFVGVLPWWGALSSLEPIWIGLVCVIAVAATRKLAPYRRLLAAKPWTGELGDHLRVEGAVRDPTPVAVGSLEAAALGRIATYDRGSGSDPDTLISQHYLNDNTFLVDATAGVVEVDPDETVWASTVITHGTGSTFSIAEVIPIGGKLLAAGSIVAGEPGRPPRLRAKGTQPAVVLATSPYGDPLGISRALVHHHYVTLAGLFALAAATVAVSISR